LESSAWTSTSMICAGVSFTVASPSMLAASVPLPRWNTAGAFGISRAMAFG